MGLLFTQRVCPGEWVLAGLVWERRAAARPYGFEDSDTATELGVEMGPCCFIPGYGDKYALLDFLYPLL